VGKRTLVQANFFRINAFSTADVQHYDLDTSSVPDALLKKNKLWPAIMKQHGASLGITTCAYDGVHNVYANHKLKFGDEAEFEVVMEDTNKTYKLTLKYAASYNTETMNMFLQGKASHGSHCQTTINAMDIAFRMDPRIRFHMRPKSRSFYIANRPDGPDMNLGSGVEVYQGYYQSVRPAANKLFVNLDVSAAAFFCSGKVSDVAAMILDVASPMQLSGKMSAFNVSKLKKALKKVRVQTNYRGNKNSGCSIQDLGEPADKHSFTDDKGKKYTVAQYYAQQYQIRLKYPFLNVLITNKERNIAIPMECCDIVAGTMYTHKLDPKQQSNMILVAAQPPHERKAKIDAGRKQLKYEANPYLKEFGIQVAQEMAQVNARILPTPQVIYNRSSKEPTVLPRDGAWNLRNKKAAQGVRITNWAVVSFASPSYVTKDVVTNFVEVLRRSAHDSGITFAKPPQLMPPPPKAPTKENGIIGQALMRAVKSFGPTRCELVLVILWDTNADIYGEVKRICDTEHGVASQCVQAKHLMNPNPQYCANVLLKINVKLPNGINSIIDLKKYKNVQKAWIFGADVTHPSPGSGSPSIAAMCASWDESWSRYRAAVRIQPSSRKATTPGVTSGVEMIKDLKGMVLELLRAAKGPVPEHILFYRDGVSENQFAEVLSAEVRALREACADYKRSKPPKITFVVVQKRHHARFFPLADEDRDRSGNLQSGTVVESDVTHPFEFDFYLQSHGGLKGTSRPAHYHVLMDENKFGADDLQLLTHHLCFTYARCTRSVSLVPPAYYAHLIAARARYHVAGGWDSESASTTTERSARGGDISRIKEEVLKTMYFC